MRSAPSRSAMASVNPLSASASSGFCSLSTPAPVHGASVSSTSSSPSTSAIFCVDTYSSGQAPLDTQPGQNATFMRCSSFEPSADFGEDSFHPLQAWDLVMQDGGQLASAQQVQRGRQGLQLRADVKQTDRLGHKRQLVEPAAVAH